MTTTSPILPESSSQGSITLLSGWKSNGKDFLFQHLSDNSFHSGVFKHPKHPGWYVFGDSSNVKTMSLWNQWLKLLNKDNEMVKKSSCERYAFADLLKYISHAFVLNLDPQSLESWTKIALFDALSILFLPIWSIAFIITFIALLQGFISLHFGITMLFLTFVLGTFTQSSTLVLFYENQFYFTTIWKALKQIGRLTKWYMNDTLESLSKQEKLELFKEGLFFIRTRPYAPEFYNSTPIHPDNSNLPSCLELPAYQSLRETYIDVGTGVRKVDPSYWIKETTQNIIDQMKSNQNMNAIITDCRFPNEISEVSKIATSINLPCYTVRLFRAQVAEPARNSKIPIEEDSEHALNSYQCDLLLVDSIDSFEQCKKRFKQYENFAYIAALKLKSNTC